MANGDRQGICCIIGPGNMVHVEENANHRLDLLLGRAAIADYSLLYLKGGVLADGEAGVSGRKDGDTASVPNGEGGTHVLIEKKLLDCHCAGLVLFYKVAEAFVEHGETLDQGSMRGSIEGTILDHPEALTAHANTSLIIRTAIDKPVPHDGRTGVDAKSEKGCHSLEFLAMSYELS
jgi:hypothetical protein